MDRKKCCAFSLGS
jgi:hypothetical protein